MYSPLNIVKAYDHLIKSDQRFTSYQSTFKEKYNLSSDLLNLIDLISLEDLIAFKLEKSLNVFNGKMLFPLKNIYLNLIDIAYTNVINSYETLELKKIIRHTFNGKKFVNGVKAREELNKVEKLKNA